jgi:cellulose synthase operon protein C
MFRAMKPYVFAIALSGLIAVTAGAQAADLNETDLAALRYFLSIKDEASVAAEIDRLREEFPGADIQGTLSLIDAKASEIDTSPIWRKIESKDYADARSLITSTRAAHPDWTPPADMLEILDSNQGQASFDAAYADRDRAAVIEALTAYPTILNCDRINNAWRLAELQVADGLAADALTTYDGILKSCEQEDYVIATLQKANELGDKNRLEQLFAVAEGRNPVLAARLATLEVELGVGPPEAVAAVAAPAAPQPARNAPSGGGGSSQLSRAAAAADRGDWASCFDLTSAQSSLEMINQRSWCAYNLGRAREAAAGFGKVSQSGGSSMARDATYGLILAYARLDQLDQAASVAARAKLTPKQRVVVNQAVISKLASASFKKKQYRKTLDYLEQLSRDSGSLDRGLAMLRGWALLKSGRRGPARDQFARIHASSPGKDSLQGMIEAR